MIAHLHSHGIELVRAVAPLHEFEEIRRRWQDDPSYPNAEKLSNELVALSVLPPWANKARHIRELIEEVDNA
ncbi:hypothetical protein HC928_11645 [bacterium]|nr:hypothetical protein [bacterium]